VQVTSEDGGVQIQADYYYDALLQRKARIERAEFNGFASRGPLSLLTFSTRGTYQVIELYQYEGGVYYEIDLTTDKCVKGKLNSPFIPHGVSMSCSAVMCHSLCSPQL
jgi:hypothetical protein